VDFVTKSKKCKWVLKRISEKLYVDFERGGKSRTAWSQYERLCEWMLEIDHEGLEWVRLGWELEVEDGLEWISQSDHAGLDVVWMFWLA